MKIFLAKSIVTMFFVTCFVSSIFCQTETASGWQKIDEKTFTFLLPKGFSRTGMTGIENYLGEFRKGKTRFLFIADATASDAYDERYDPETMKDYKETETIIKGRKINIRTFTQIRDGKPVYRAEQNIGNWEKSQVELYMELESDNPDDLKAAKQVFDSIAFSKQSQKSKK